MRFSGTLLLILLFFGVCKKEAATTFKNVKGTMTGAPGCTSWIILQDNGTNWEPDNLGSFQVTLKAGQPVIFSFVVDNDNGSFCMTGPRIRLTSIQDQ
jgi:hypothetical protein